MVVDLWYWFTAGLEPDAVEALAAVLSDEERRRAARFVRAPDRRDYVAAHALVRHALSHRAVREYGRESAASPYIDPEHHGRAYPPGSWAFTAGAHGKPLLVPPAPDVVALPFNLSHTAGLVACVVNREHAVGVDVEAVAPRARADIVARERFAPEEVEALAALDEPARLARFTELWTLREAYVKGTGAGLWGPDLPELSFSFPAPDGLECRRDTGAAAWEFALLVLDGYRMAVALDVPPSDGGRWALSLNAVVAEGDGAGVRPSIESRGLRVRWTGALTMDAPRLHDAAIVGPTPGASR